MNRILLSSSTPRGRRGTARILAGTALAVLALSGCSDARRAIGLDRNAPDEFAVVSRAPLSMPPSMALAPPRPGAPRPQESTTNEVAAATVFGGAGAPPRGGRSRGGAVSGGEMALLTEAGAQSADPDIRNKVDEETTSLIVADKRWVDTLLFWQTQEPPYTIVDAQKEAQRLREAQAQGKPLTDGPTPTIQRKRKAPLEGLF